jgi:hypothetical protein
VGLCRLVPDLRVALISTDHARETACLKVCQSDIASCEDAFLVLQGLYRAQWLGPHDARDGTERREAIDLAKLLQDPV